ncbi:MAG TPA: flagellar brake protein [Lachnospiraceae bacterium]|nr:flagellar brake protein [Lachnospiraceae bacterium]
MAFKKAKAEPMLSKYIKEGDKVDIESIVRAGKDSEKRQYRTMVYDIVSEDQIRIAMPMEQGKVILLPVDAEYNLCFYTKNGLYQCIAKVLERNKNGNVFSLLMELVTDLSKYQRREYYRLNTVLEMKASKVADEVDMLSTEEVEIIDTDITFDNGVMVDISGGGARFISRTQYPVGSEVLFKFKLFVSGKINEYTLHGRVLFSQPLKNNPGAYEHRMQFIRIPKDDRESIIRYIFEEERKIRRREKG